MLSPGRALRRFQRDRRGVSAVEFALIAPIMIMFYFGLVEVCEAMFAERRANHVASAVGDLITQYPAVSTDDLSDIFKIGNLIMAPFATTTMKTCASSITYDGTKLNIDWVANGSTGAPAVNCTITSDFPVSSTDNTKPFISSGESVVLSRVEYAYDFPTKIVVKSGITFKEAFYLRPRKSTKVVCTIGTSSTPCLNR